MPKGKWISTQNQKIGFLRRRPDLWDASQKAIKDAFVNARLCSDTTYCGDLRIERMRAKVKAEKSEQNKDLRWCGTATAISFFC